MTSTAIPDSVLGRVIRGVEPHLGGIQAGLTGQLARLPSPGPQIRDLADVVLALPGARTPSTGPAPGWDQPLDFDPGRWDAPARGQRHAYLPFGAGPEMRPASGFAIWALEHLSRQILRRYHGTVHLRRHTPHARGLLAPPSGWTRLVPASSARDEARKATARAPVLWPGARLDE